MAWVKIFEVRQNARTGVWDGFFDSLTFLGVTWNCEWFAQADPADHLRWSPAVLLWPPCGWPADDLVSPLVAPLPSFYAARANVSSSRCRWTAAARHPLAGRSCPPAGALSWLPSAPCIPQHTFHPAEQLLSEATLNVSASIRDREQIANTTSLVVFIKLVLWHSSR